MGFANDSGNIILDLHQHMAVSEAGWCCFPKMMQNRKPIREGDGMIHVPGSLQAGGNGVPVGFRRKRCGFVCFSGCREPGRGDVLKGEQGAGAYIEPNWYWFSQNLPFFFEPKNMFLSDNRYCGKYEGISISFKV